MTYFVVGKDKTRLWPVGYDGDRGILTVFQTKESAVAEAKGKAESLPDASFFVCQAIEEYKAIVRVEKV